MYCTNCGRKLPEDGSPCVCRQQPAQPEQNTNTAQPPVYTPPVNTAPNFTQPPQYYAQQPVQYPTRQPARPVTPVHELLKRTASSKLFLACAVLVTASMVLALIAAFIAGAQALSTSTLFTNSNVSYDSFNVEFRVNITSAGGILGIIAFWLLYASAKKKDTPFVGTAGITLFRALEIIRIVACGFLIGIVLILAVVCIATGALYPVNPLARIAAAPVWESGWFIVLCLVLILAAAVVTIFYSVKLLRTLKSLKYSEETGALPLKFAKLVLAGQILQIAVGVIGAIVCVAMGAWYAAPSSLCDAAAGVCLLLCMMQFNRETDALQDKAL